MKSSVSSNCTHNIHRPSMPNKEVNQKEKTVGKIAKRPQIATDLIMYTCLDIELSKVLSHYKMFPDKENRDLLSKIYCVSFCGIS